jgi:hypothetical protein
MEEIAMRCQRMKAKERIAQMVVAGELGLFPAAAWFREINSSGPAYTDRSWCMQPGQSDGEKLCRQVIAWSRSELDGVLPDNLIQARVRELEKELDDHIARYGKVILEEQ